MLNSIYKDLFTLCATSGNEKPVRDYMVNFIMKYKNYEIMKDNLGSIVAYKKASINNAKTVLIAGHMDEVGLIVTKINENGSLKIEPIGGLNADVFISQVLNVHTKKGIIKGVIGAIPPHLKKENSTSISNLVLDIGLNSKIEAIEYGVELGQMVLFDNPFSYTVDKKRVISKAVDNRYGCGLALEIVKKFNDIDLPFNLVVGATVMEEVGLRGAETLAKMIKPDLFFALDASPVNDILDKDSLGKLGDGFLVRLYDPKNVISQGLLEYIVNLANKKKIKYQYFKSLGGTDAAKTFDLLNGIPSTTIGLPARYIHSTAAMMDLQDLQSAKMMIFSIIKDLNEKKILKIING